mgnify:CR=1 FL=1
MALRGGGKWKDLDGEYIFFRFSGSISFDSSITDLEYLVIEEP